VVPDERGLAEAWFERGGVACRRVLLHGVADCLAALRPASGEARHGADVGTPSALSQRQPDTGHSCRRAGA
jgi:hypothetical protein